MHICCLVGGGPLAGGGSGFLETLLFIVDICLVTAVIALTGVLFYAS